MICQQSTDYEAVHLNYLTFVRILTFNCNERTDQYPPFFTGDKTVIEFVTNAFMGGGYILLH